MLLSAFELTNFLSHTATSVSLERTSVFVGPCNSGKSAVFDGLLNLAQLAKGKISQVFSPGPWSYAATLNRNAAPNGQIAFGATFADTGIRYQIAYREVQQNRFDEPRYEIISESLTQGSEQLFDRSLNKFAPKLAMLKQRIGPDIGILAAVRASNDTQIPESVRIVAANVSRIVKYRLEPSNLRKVSDVPEADSRPRLRPRGEGLAALLYFRELEGKLETLNTTLREVLPGFEAFEFNTTRDQEVGFSIRFSDARGRVSAARLSDGALHMVGLAALLLQDPKDLPALMCLEEPEIGLNSSSMRKLVSIIHEASAIGPQILISTHNPYLLAELWNHSTGNPFQVVKYVKIDAAGSTRVEPMATFAIDPQIRREIDVRTAARMLDGNLADPVER